MSALPQGAEHHFVHRIGWLRAAVLGANDGIVSTASLIVGVAAATPDRSSILIAGVAGWVAGAMSMAAGEYVSVSSQSDTEQADLETERRALEEAPEVELEELAEIYVGRGVEIGLARQVAAQLMEHDSLGAHARDELGISETVGTRPVQAALTSAATFSVGAILPAGGGGDRTRGACDPGGLDRLAREPGAARRGGRPCRRLGHGQGRAAGDPLGRARDGGHGRHRRFGRQGRLSRRHRRTAR